MRCVLVALLGAVLFPSSASAQEGPLTLSEVLGRARERAARLIAAAGRVEEVQASLLPAGRRLRENPLVELQGGRRQAGETFTDYEISLSQAFEPAVRRRARVAGVETALETARAELEDVRRLFLGEVAAAFERALGAQERLRFTNEAARLADDLLVTIERRYGMGEITALELNRARTAAARARADRGATEGERLAAGGALRALLGLPPGEALAVAGSPRELTVYELEPLLARAAERPDLEALAAAVRAAEAEIRLGETLARPDLSWRTGYQREEGADVVSAGLAVALPLFQRGQETQAVGRARAASLRAQLEAAKRTAAAEVQAALETYRRRVQTVEELERTAMPAVDDNAALAQRSFDVGEINLGDLLLIRREILETRLTYLDLLLDARLAAAELETRAGVRR